ncbi:hypothetical protein AHiyo6_00540 [Arthrobacter sp. Hiyo6]|nr:hypothetical protein AHiyo6_00540 [Arthrobacter sp. Hiyo6]
MRVDFENSNSIARFLIAILTTPWYIRVQLENLWHHHRRTDQMGVAKLGGEEEEEEYSDSGGVWARSIPRATDSASAAMATDAETAILLTFFSRDYRLFEFVEAIENLECLLILGLENRRLGTGSETTQRGLAWERQIKERMIDLHADIAPKIKLLAVSMRSPLDILVDASATSAALVSMLTGWVILRGKWEASRKLAAQADVERIRADVQRAQADVQRAEANNAMLKARIEEVALSYILDQISGVTTADYEGLPERHILKRYVKASAKSLSALDKVTVPSK